MPADITFVAAVPQADCEIVQNQRQAARNRYWVPHWPPPGLIPRDPNRTGVQRVVFTGTPKNLAGGETLWASALSERGIARRH